MLLKETQIDRFRNDIMNEIKEEVKLNYETTVKSEEFKNLKESFKNSEKLKNSIINIEKEQNAEIDLLNIRKKLQEINKFYTIAYKYEDDNIEDLYFSFSTLEEINDHFKRRIEQEIENFCFKESISELKISSYIDFCTINNLSNKIATILGTLDNASYEDIKAIVYEKLGDIDYLFTTE